MPSSPTSILPAFAAAASPPHGRSSNDDDLFGPPAPKPVPLWAAGFAACVLVLGASLLHTRAPRASSLPARAAHDPAPAAKTAAVPISLQQDLPLAAPKPPRLVVKCVVAGRVSYSELSSCRGKATQLAFSGAADLGAAPTSGGERSLLASADAQIESLAAAIDVGGPSALAPAAAGPVSPACAALARDIATLASASRSRLSAHEQDRVRITRERVRAQQASLGC